MAKRKKHPRPNEMYAAQIAVWLREGSGVVPWRDVQDPKLHRYELGATLYERYEDWCDDQSQSWNEGKPGALPVFPASPITFYRTLERAGLDRHVLAGHICFLCAKLPYPSGPNKFRHRVITSAMLVDMEREADTSTPGRGDQGVGSDAGHPQPCLGHKTFLGGEK